MRPSVLFFSVRPAITPYPANGGGGGGITGSVTLAKFDAIRVDLIGDGGMTPAQVVDVMGFGGERLDSVRLDFSTSTVMYFRESPKKYIKVSFNRNQKAIYKNLYGIQVLSLAKYQSIKTGSKTGSSLAEVNSIMGFKGMRQPAYTARKTTDYSWISGSARYVFIRFNANDKAVSKSLVDGGFPEMITLEKYNRIVVKSGTVRGMNLEDVNRIMGFRGPLQRRKSDPRKIIYTHRWSGSAEKYIEVDFLSGTEAIAVRASGVPGAQLKP